MEHRSSGPARYGDAGYCGHVHKKPDEQPIVQRRPIFEAVTDRATPASKANAQIRKIIELLPHDDGHPVDFYCECGCGKTVPLTIAEYDALAGRPIRGSGHRAE